MSTTSSSHSLRTLTALPPELLLTILEHHLPSVYDLFHLSLTCHTLHNLSKSVITKARSIAFQQPLAPSWMKLLPPNHSGPNNYYTLIRSPSLPHTVHISGDPALSAFLCWAHNNPQPASCISSLSIDFGVYAYEDFCWLIGLNSIPQSPTTGRLTWDRARWGYESVPPEGWYLWPLAEKRGYQTCARLADKLMSETGLNEKLKMPKSVWVEYHSDRLPVASPREMYHRHEDVGWYVRRACAIIAGPWFREGVRHLKVSAEMRQTFFHKEMLFMLLQDHDTVLPKLESWDSTRMWTEMTMLPVLLARPRMKKIAMDIQSPDWRPNKWENQRWAEAAMPRLTGPSNVEELRLGLPKLRDHDWLLDVVRACPKLRVVRLWSRLKKPVDVAVHDRRRVRGRETRVWKFYNDMLTLLGTEQYRDRIQDLQLVFENENREFDPLEKYPSYSDIVKDPGAVVPSLRGFVNITRLEMPYMMLLGRYCLGKAVQEDETCRRFTASLAERLPPKLRSLKLTQFEQFQKRYCTVLRQRQAVLLQRVLEGIVERKKELLPMLKEVVIVCEVDTNAVDFSPVIKKAKKAGISIPKMKQWTPPGPDDLDDDINSDFDEDQPGYFGEPYTDNWDSDDYDEEAEHKKKKPGWEHEDSDDADEWDDEEYGFSEMAPQFGQMNNEFAQMIPPFATPAPVPEGAE